MSDDKRLKSTEIIYNDRAPTELTPEVADPFGKNLGGPSGPVPASTGGATQIHFADAVPAHDATGANAQPRANEVSPALAALSAAMGLPPSAVSHMLSLLPQDAIAKLAVQLGMSQQAIEQIQASLQMAPAAAAPNGFYTPRPTTGWLVVTKGPGRGSSLPISFGRNEVGRDADQAVPLVFGDDQISRRNQFVITYDPRSGKFLCSPGEATRNLCYVSGEPLVTPLVLNGPTDIEVGNTILRFMPLCDESFSWSAN